MKYQDELDRYLQLCDAVKQNPGDRDAEVELVSYWNRAVSFKDIGLIAVLHRADADIVLAVVNAWHKLPEGENKVLYARVNETRHGGV